VFKINLAKLSEYYVTMDGIEPKEGFLEQISPPEAKEGRE
jgi:hypothetical protein